MQHVLFDTSAAPVLPTLPVQRWWRLQGDARRRGRGVEPLVVTPRFLARIDARHCPVTREGLVPRSARAVPLRPDATVAAGHLVTVGRRAADAIAATAGAWAAAWELATQVAERRAQEPSDTQPEGDMGLDAAAWRRLAVLCSFVQPLSPAQAAALPLLVLPPPRLRVLSPVQALQVAVTLALRGADRATRLLQLALLTPDEDVRLSMRVFLLTLLARCPGTAAAGDEAAERQALEDLWQDPLVQRRWQRLAQRLTDDAATALLQRAHRQRLLGEGWRPLDRLSAVDGWDLPRPAALESADAACPAPAARRLALPVLAAAGSGHGADAVATPAAGH